MKNSTGIPMLHGYYVSPYICQFPRFAVTDFHPDAGHYLESPTHVWCLASWTPCVQRSSKKKTFDKTHPGKKTKLWRHESIWCKKALTLKQKNIAMGVAMRCKDPPNGESAKGTSTTPSQVWLATKAKSYLVKLCA